jgi:flagellar biosynthesis component FlhA
VKEFEILMKQRFKYGDAVLVLLIVAIAAMLITPLPTTLLDLLIVVNLSFSILLLLVGLYLPNSLALLSFPTVLLLSALFRLALNVAATRLVLSQGDAGAVIESFGTFLIRGDIVVGIIIFLIVTIVNFIVISRGANRVSEVAGRFTLESIPGKQLTIDNDYKTGLISAEEARRKRDELKRETQLYGSMDGAMKFVQGDAIAGLVIIITNIVGGMYQGISRGMNFGDAVQTYAALTIGEGLVSQIPALLTSICAGIVVTRVPATDTSTLSSDLRGQLFSQPSVIFTTGLIVILLAVFAGLPMAPFLLVGLGAIGASALMMRRRREQGLAPLGLGEYGKSPVPSGGSGSRDEEDSVEEKLVVYVDTGLSYRSYRNSIARYRAAWQEFRTLTHAQMGVWLPELIVSADDLLAPSCFVVEWNGTSILQGSGVSDGALVEVNPGQATALGLEVLQETAHPISGQQIFWALETPAMRRITEAGDIRVYDFFESIFLQIVSFSLRHPEEFLASTDVYGLLRTLEKKHPGLLAEGFHKLLSVPRLTEVMQDLVRQSVSVRDFQSVVESVAAYCSSNGISSADESGLDIDDVIAFVRSARRRVVVAPLVNVRGSLPVITLSSEVEAIFEDLPSASGAAALAVEPDVFDLLQGSLSPILRAVRDSGVCPMTILCRADLRVRVMKFVRLLSPLPSVLSFDEVEPSVKVEQLGVWGVSRV